MFKPEQVGKRTRYTYAKINEVIKMPHLLDIQRKSYEWFLESGLQNIFNDISPIKDNSGNLVLSFEGFSLGEPKYDINECKNRDATYAAPLRVNIRLVNNDPENMDIKEQEVFMGDFPLMTDTGTFIINGAERVIVSQLVRSPGVYYNKEIDTMGNRLYDSTVIPNRGAWIELETDASEVVAVRIDRNRKLPATVLVRALGWDTNESILDLFWNGKTDEDGLPVYDERIVRTLEKDTTQSADEALVEIYKKLRPGEPPTVESARNLFDNLFFDARRYDLARVGRYKLNKKLGWRQRMLGQTLAQPIVDPETGEIILDAGVQVGEEQLDIVANSHVFDGEGFAEFRDAAQLAQLEAQNLVGLRFVDHYGQPTEQYPLNPNGSVKGITAVTTTDGRSTIMMPHPERVFRTVSHSWHPENWGEDSPWMRLFRNARKQFD